MTKRAPTAVEFTELSEEIQLNILQKDGAYAGKRIVNGKTFILFQLYGFYVEVQYKLYRKEVSRLVISSDTSILAPYLDQIKIEDLDGEKGPEKE